MIYLYRTITNCKYKSVYEVTCLQIIPIATNYWAGCKSSRPCLNRKSDTSDKFQRCIISIQTTSDSMKIFPIYGCLVEWTSLLHPGVLQPQQVFVHVFHDSGLFLVHKQVQVFLFRIPSLYKTHSADWIWFQSFQFVYLQFQIHKNCRFFNAWSAKS